MNSEDGNGAFALINQAKKIKIIGDNKSNEIESNEYIFCSVKFGRGCKSYYYLTEDDTLAIGDFVIVPVGEDGHSAIVEIVNIEYFPKDKIPFPLDRVKPIIRKYKDDDHIELDAVKHIIDKQSESKVHMIPFEQFVLCNVETPRVNVMVWVCLSEGCLKISGQDFGQAVIDFFGKDEHEYIYNFDQENTERLFALLTPERQKIKEVLLHKFGGIDGCNILIEFCDANSITYRTFTW